MASLGEELQLRIKNSLEAEVSFYASRGLITNEEQLLIADTFREAAKVASHTLPLALHQRPLVFAQNPDVQEKTLSEKIEGAIESAMTKLGIKATYDDSPWNGDAGQWKTAEAYCASCLIDMNTGGGPKTKDKCKLPYKKPGSSSINKGALRAMASGGRGLTALKGVSKDQIAKAANFMIRHWQAAFDKPAPANVYRMAGKEPPKGTKETSTKFFKDAQGQWWMLGIYSNRWMDRENEILSESAHKEYAEWVNKSGFKPQVVVYHLPKMPNGFWEKVWDKWGENVERLNEVVKKVYQKTSLGEVERIVYLNGFSVSVAKIYPERYGAAEKLAEMQDTGMSHGFLVFGEEDPDSFSPAQNTVNIVSKYRSFEVSVLLRKRAANYGTAPLFVEGKSVPYSDEDRKMISDLLGEEITNALDSNTKAASEVLDELLEYKELGDTEPGTEEKSEPSEEETKAMSPEMHPSDEEDEEEDMDEEKEKKPEEVSEEKQVETDTKETGVVVTKEEVIEAVVKVLNVEQLQTMLSTIVENQKKLSEDVAALQAAKEEVKQDVKQLKQTDDEKIAAMFNPINWGSAGFSPATSDKTAISKEIAEKVAGPDKEKSSPTGDPTADLFLQTILPK